MYKEQIAKDLNEKNGIMILLNGKWGSGKTYRWKHFISKELKKKKALYFSLFGMASVDDLKKEIFNAYVAHKTKWSLKHIFSSILIFILTFIFIVNLILMATLYVSEKFISINSLSGADTISYIKEVINIFSSDNIFWIVLSVSLFFIFLLWAHRQAIAIYFLNELMGINYNNVQLNKLYSPKKIVFCFDDFERISHTAATDEFLGYFNSLSKIFGFNILLIANSSAENKSHNNELEDIISKENNTSKESSDERDKSEQNYLIKYQEKLFDKIYIHEEFKDVKELIREWNTNKTLQECLMNIYEKLNFADKNSEMYKTAEREFIKTASNNLRLLKKIKDNMDIIYDNISYKNLEKEKNHCHVINFVAGMTLGFETGRYKTISDYCDEGEETFIYRKQSATEKDFRDIFFEGFFYNYKSTYDLIYKGEISCKLKEELLPSQHNKYTIFEKNISQLKEKHFLNYTSQELEKWLKKIDICINEGTLFSSYKMMYPSIVTYCILLDYNGKHLVSYKTKKIIEKEISHLIKEDKIFPNENHKISSGWSVSGDILNDVIYLDNYIFKEEVKNEIKNLKNSGELIDNFLEISNSDEKYMLDILSILLFSNGKIINFDTLYVERYDDFQNLVYKLFSFNISPTTYKKVCDILEYSLSSYRKLIDKLCKIMKKNAMQKERYSSEYKNYQNMLEELEKVKQRQIYKF